MIIAVMAFAETCGQFAATYAFVHKKSDEWAQMLINGMVHNFDSSWKYEMHQLTEHAEDDNGNVRVN